MDNLTEKELDKRAKDFMTFPPKISDGRKNDKDNLGGFKNNEKDFCY